MCAGENCTASERDRYEKSVSSFDLIADFFSFLFFLPSLCKKHFMGLLRFAIINKLYPGTVKFIEGIRENE